MDTQYIGVHVSRIQWYFLKYGYKIQRCSCIQDTMILPKILIHNTEVFMYPEYSDTSQNMETEYRGVHVSRIQWYFLKYRYRMQRCSCIQDTVIFPKIWIQNTEVFNNPGYSDTSLNMDTESRGVHVSRIQWYFLKYGYRIQRCSCI